jgi:hypothetical protein
LATFEPIDRIGAHARLSSEILGAPAKRCPRHTALKWLHVVRLSPAVVDFKPVMMLPLVV